MCSETCGTMWSSRRLPPTALSFGSTNAPIRSSERRPNELDNLRKYLTDNGLRYDERGSGMARGYAKEKVRLFWIARYEGAAEPAKSKG